MLKLTLIDFSSVVVPCIQDIVLILSIGNTVLGYLKEKSETKS